MQRQCERQQQQQREHQPMDGHAQRSPEELRQDHQHHKGQRSRRQHEALYKGCSQRERVDHEPRRDGEPVPELDRRQPHGGDGADEQNEWNWHRAPSRCNGG
jgi:hypothetical protein